VTRSRLEMPVDGHPQGSFGPRMAVIGQAADTSLPGDSWEAEGLPAQHRSTTAGRKPASRSRMLRNSSRGTATSAIWKTRYAHRL
jgi:hypothetical protein